MFRDCEASVFSEKSVDLADSFESLCPVFDKEGGIDGDFVLERVDNVGLNVICALVARSSGVFSAKQIMKNNSKSTNGDVLFLKAECSATDLNQNQYRS